MADLFRRILYPAFVATIIATIWALGHAQAMADRAYNRWYGPPDGVAARHVEEDDGSADTAADAEPAPVTTADGLGDLDF